MPPTNVSTTSPVVRANATARGGKSLHARLVARMIKRGEIYLLRGERGPVGTEAAELAERWCAFLEAHARRVYASAAESEAHAARLLLKKIRAGELPDPFTFRDVYRKGWAGLTKPERVQGAVD